MAASYIQVTNQQDTHVQNGIPVLITLNSSESINKLPLLAVNMKCILGSKANSGYIISVDPLGHTFKIHPYQRDKALDGVSSNYIYAGEIIQIQLS
jgi:hypothetical protein